jgi:large exoprotein involved in heme utilization and adhesion
MRNNSSISAQGTGDANGGNITITAPDGFVVAFPKQNNDIIATAQAGKGGQININAQRVYGFNKERIQSIEVDPQTLSNNGENDINSTSADPQLSGNINLNTEQLDPASLKQEELLATNKASDRSEDVLDDRASEEIMNLLYSQGLGQ